MRDSVLREQVVALTFIIEAIVKALETRPFHDEGLKAKLDDLAKMRAYLS